MQLKNPFLVGFGIKDKASFDAVNAFSNGAIIGSAYIQALSKGNDVESTTKIFLGKSKKKQWLFWTSIIAKIDGHLLFVIN